MSTTIINNDNLQTFVINYMVDKTQLPDDLRDIPMEEWNVSRVTSMSNLFNDARIHQTFNEPLNRWDVSNVTDMTSMFEGCVNFNQPLDRWRVFNVESMTSMFDDCENFNQRLNEWNVSKVEDMSFMFSGCRNFNRPLNDWDVTNVTYMASMFSGCDNFNQPLNDWEVSNVVDMSSMFSGCRNFNQPLNDWDISNVTDMSSMFMFCRLFNQQLDWDLTDGRNISDMFSGSGMDNRPIQPAQPLDPSRPRVDPLQVHREAAKINYTELNAFLREKLSNLSIPERINYANFINEKVLKLIDDSNNSEETKVQQRDNLRRIMNERLAELNYQEQPILVRESIFYTLNYVLDQPDNFKEMYLDSFIQDCIHAYEGEDGMSCAAGALERIVFSLLPACSTVETNPDYKTIVDLITGNPRITIPTYIQDWYKLHKIGTPGAFPDGTTKEQMRSDLKNYLLRIFPNESELIDEQISRIADNIGYDENSFTYGGKKRKTKKTKKTKKIKKIKKTKKINKIKKSKKTKKANRTKRQRKK